VPDRTFLAVIRFVVDIRWMEVGLVHEECPVDDEMTTSVEGEAEMRFV